MTEHLRRSAGEVEDGRLDAQHRRTGVEHEVDVAAEIRTDVRRSGGADAAEPVG